MCTEIQPDCCYFFLPIGSIAYFVAAVMWFPFVLSQLLGDDIQRWWGRGMRTAEQQANDSFHCKTPDCGGWCYYEDDVDVFACPVSLTVPRC